ncbi:MAG: cyclic nucleotide-binding domain-containing protein [Acidobacteriota bacterium]
MNALTEARDLAGHPMFSGLGPAEVEVIARAGMLRVLHAGDVLMREGQVDDALELVMEGEADVTSTGRGGELHSLATVGPGALLGETGFLCGQERTATVRAKGPMRSFRLPGARLDLLLEEGEPAARKLLRRLAVLLAERQRESNSRIMELLAQTRDPKAPVKLNVMAIQEKLARAMKHGG